MVILYFSDADKEIETQQPRIVPLFSPYDGQVVLEELVVHSNKTRYYLFNKILCFPDNYYELELIEVDRKSLDAGCEPTRFLRLNDKYFEGYYDYTLDDLFGYFVDPHQALLIKITTDIPIIEKFMGRFSALFSLTGPELFFY